MLPLPVRHRLLSVLPSLKMTSVNIGDLIGRKPLKILDSEGKPYYPEPEIPSQSEPSNDRESAREKRRFSKKAYEEFIRSRAYLNVKKCYFDERFTYVPVSPSHPDFLRAKLICRGLTKEKKNYIALEGKNLIQDALSCGLKLDKLFFTQESILQDIGELGLVLERASKGEYEGHGTVFMKINPALMSQLSRLDTPPGILALFERPGKEEGHQSSVSRSCGLPITVIGDNIRDPGNMGTLVRSAAAVGVERLVCSTGSVDPWGSKVVRSGAGAHFRVNLMTGFEWRYLPELLLPLDSTIIFAEKVDYGCKGEGFDSNRISLPVKNYTHLDYSVFSGDSKKLCLVIGGETKGISDEAYNETKNYQRYKVTIPMMKGIDSLNSAVAGSIILFEIQRQIMNKVDSS